MRRSSQSSPSRGGFTLVELLVVITIIAIMFALISAAAVKIIGKGDEVKLRSEISQLSLAVNAFKQQFAVGYVPDRIVLPPGYDSATAQYFKSVWPRLSSSTQPVNANTLGTGTSPITVNGVTYPRGVFDYWQVPGNNPIILQGDQALVFWLAGPSENPNFPNYPSTPPMPPANRLNWSSDVTDPMKPGGSRLTTFFSFPNNRLQYFAGTGTRTANFPSFVDVYGGAPYLYFSTNRADNNYTSNITFAAVTVNPYLVSGTVGSSTSPPRFANPSSFQIISAGKDGSFGNGLNEWAGYTPNGGGTQTGYDDVANFHPTFLGIPAQ
jgi:prepilin-type N-terminal cleavage/methylation domain-containing protein